MTKGEFRDWLAFHIARFPSLMTWFGKIPEQGHGGMPSRSDVLGAWLETVECLSLEEAKDASRLMRSLPESESPKSADAHPAKVLELARKGRRGHSEPAWRPRLVDGHEVYSCLKCRDSGAVIVYSPATIRLVKNGGTRPLNTAAVQCTCEAAKGKRWMGVVYDPERMLRKDPERLESEQLDDIRQWQPKQDGARA